MSGKELSCRHAKHTHAGKEVSRKARGRSTLETERSRRRTRSHRASRTAQAPIPKSCWVLAAALAGCCAMALSLILGNAGFKPDYVDATAHVTVSPQGGGFKITKSQ